MFKLNDGFASGILAFGLMVSPLANYAQAQTQPPMTLKSVSIDLPNGDRMFPGGAQAEAINNNCLACHSAGMVLNQPALPKAAWETEVHKMINVYKAPVAQEDVPAIVGYLAATKGAR
jgi:hypothetical protein